jgi:hypothetical protein
MIKWLDRGGKCRCVRAKHNYLWKIDSPRRIIIIADEASMAKHTSLLFVLVKLPYLLALSRATMGSGSGSLHLHMQLKI